MSKNPPTSFVNDLEADITFQSSDGTQFHLQRKYLLINTGAFPGAEFETKGEITHLTEPSAVLDILFQFVYPKRHPDLNDLKFPLISAISEAAEKYEVFAAMNVCSVKMKQFLPENAADVLVYAARHDYPNLMTEAAPHLVQLPLVDVMRQLPAHYVEPWVRYHSSWRDVFEDALKSVMDIQVAPPNPAFEALVRLTFHPRFQTIQACHACLFTMVAAIKELEGLTSLQALDEALEKPRARSNFCLTPFCQYTTILTKICGDISAKTKQLPAFAQLLRGK